MGLHILGFGKTDQKGPIKTNLPFRAEIYGGGEARHVAITGDIYKGYNEFKLIEQQTIAFIKNHTVAQNMSEFLDASIIHEGSRNSTLYSELCRFYMKNAHSKECFTEHLPTRGLT